MSWRCEFTILSPQITFASVYFQERVKTVDPFVNRQFFNNEAPDMQNAPFYVISESYGGKMAAAYGVVLHKGESKLNWLNWIIAFIINVSLN